MNGSEFRRTLSNIPARATIPRRIEYGGIGARSSRRSPTRKGIGLFIPFRNGSRHSLDHDNQFPCFALERHCYPVSSSALYWGETGAVGAPSLIDLPLPFVLDVPIRGPGRYLHFLSAWMLVITGLVYLVTGFLTHHFRQNLLPDKTHLSGEAIRQVVSDHLRIKRSAKRDAHPYNLLQRLTYLFVIFGLVPLMIWTGLAMSPGFTSAFPAVVSTLGGHQAAVRRR